MVGHSDGNKLTDDTEQQNAHDAVVIESQPIQKPSYHLQAPSFSQAPVGYYLPPSPPTSSFGFLAPPPTIGWIQNSDQAPPSTELQAPPPQTEEKANDDEQDDTVSIEGPQPPPTQQADDKTDEQKIAESDPEENEMKLDEIGRASCRERV